MPMTRSICLILTFCITPVAFAQQRTLLLKNPSGTTLHTVPIVGPEFLRIGDLSGGATLTLRSPSGEALHNIPLTGSEPIRITNTGDLEARCVAASGSPHCDALGPPQPAIVQGFAISVQPEPGSSIPRVNVGQAFNIEWNSTRSDLCISLGPSQLQGWADSPQPLRSFGTIQNIRFTATPATNPVTIAVRCYSGGGGSERTLSIQVG